MSNQRVKTKIEIVDQEDGTRYNGKIDFDNCSYKYDLTFTQPLSELREGNLEEFLGGTSLAVLDDSGSSVQLDEGTNDILTKELTALALEHYHHEAQKGLRFMRALRKLNPGEHTSPTLGMLFTMDSAKILNLSREYEFDPTQGLSKMARDYI